MTKTLQTVVPVELAERVARAAAKDGRSVSQWLRLLLERELERQSWSEALPPKPAAVQTFEEGGKPQDFIALTSAKQKKELEAAMAKVCSHTTTEQRKTKAMGTRTYCANPECGKML